MGSCFNGCKNLVTVPNIPESVTNMSTTFINCESFQTLPAIPNYYTGYTTNEALDMMHIPGNGYSKKNFKI